MTRLGCFMGQELIYIYCISQKKPELKDFTPDDNIYSIYYQDIYSIVSKVSENEFGEESLKKNFGDMKWVESKARKHMQVVIRIMETATVIPFKFATVFKTEDGLEKMIETYSQQIKDKIVELNGKKEWAIKIYCDMEKLRENIIKKESGIKKIRKEIKVNSSSPGKVYFLKKKEEELIKSAMQEKCAEYGERSFRILKECSFKSQINNLLPKEATEGKKDMILNASFLVEKGKVSDFMKLTDCLKTAYGDEGFEFAGTGPWPPYNFCQFSKEAMING